MVYEKEISADGENWRRVTLYAVLPIHPKSRYILAIRNRILFGFRDIRAARKQRRILRDELDKVGLLMELLGLKIRLLAIRDVRPPPQKPKHEEEAIDAEFEVVG